MYDKISKWQIRHSVTTIGKKIMHHIKGKKATKIVTNFPLLNTSDMLRNSKSSMKVVLKTENITQRFI